MTSVYKTPVIVPPDARPCRRCTVLMPVPGIVAVSRRDPGLCSECAGEGPAQPLIINDQEQTTMAQTPETPKGWGSIEKAPPTPPRISAACAEIIKIIDDTASTEWARVKAPSKQKAGYLSTKLSGIRPNLERAVRSIDGHYYLYFRIKEEQNDAAD